MGEHGARVNPTLPVARTRELIVTSAADGDVLIYDPGPHHIHKLNASAAAVWRLCDGCRTVADLARDAASVTGEPFDEVMVTLALTRLGDAGLLEQPVMAAPRLSAQSRRAFVRKAAGAVAIPAIVSMTAPTAAAAASGCTTSQDCDVADHCVAGQCVNVCHPGDTYCGADGRTCPTGTACTGAGPCCFPVCGHQTYCGPGAPHCPDGFQCVDVGGAECCQPTTCPDGVTYCGDGSPCLPGSSCVDGCCQILCRDGDTYCGDGTPCPAGYGCSDGCCQLLCHEGDTYCGDGTLCPAGYECNASGCCVPVVCPVGQTACGSSGECDPGYQCINGCCTSICSNPADYCGTGGVTCDTGYSCVNNCCTSICPNPDDYCERRRDCPYGYRCSSNCCVPRNGFDAEPEGDEALPDDSQNLAPADTATDADDGGGFTPMTSAPPVSGIGAEPAPVTSAPPVSDTTGGVVPNPADAPADPVQNPQSAPTGG